MSPAPPFPETAYSELVRRARRRRYGRNEVVFHEGDPGECFHVVTRGVFVARRYAPLGDVLAISVFREGGIFGEFAVFGDDHSRNATVAALEGGETLSVTRDDFNELRRAVPALDDWLIRVLVDKTRSLTSHVLELTFATVESRVMSRLLFYAEALGVEAGEWLPIGQQDIASMAGTTRATANRVLRRAADEGLIELARGKVRVLDVQQVRARSAA